MGKYMRKRKGVEKMPVVEGALGVRTRARALALLRESKPCSIPPKASNTDIHKICLATSVLPTAKLEIYMELRSRRLEKTPAKRSIMAAGDRISRHNLLKNTMGSFSISDNNPSRIRTSSRFNSVLSMKGRKATQGEHVCLDSTATSLFLSRVTPATSTGNSICMSERQPASAQTRHQRQENASREWMDVDEEVVVPREVDQSRIDANVLSSELEKCFGETAVSKNDRESTPESHTPGMDTPGSTTKAHHITRGQRDVPHINCTPSWNETEDFFRDAEKQELKKFMERYNFDPYNENPLRGRYEWICM